MQELAYSIYLGSDKNRSKLGKRVAKNNPSDTASLKEIQENAAERVEQIIKQLKSKSNLTENMKNTDMFYWVGMMNNFKNQAEEIVFNEIIYV